MKYILITFGIVLGVIFTGAIFYVRAAQPSITVPAGGTGLDSVPAGALLSGLSQLRLTATSAPTANYFTASSTTNKSVFPIASTTSFSIANLLNVNGAGTSTFTGGGSFGTLSSANGVNIAAGCYSVNGTCIGYGTSNVTLSGTPGALMYADSSSDLHGTTTIAVANIIATTTAINVLPSASTTSLTVGNLLQVQGAATSSFTGGLTVAGLDSSRGLRVSTGDTVLSGGLSVTGSSVLPIASSTSFSISNLLGVNGLGTSTFAGGLSTGYLSSGSHIISNLLTVQGTGTSTFTGALTAGALAVGTATPSALFGSQFGFPLLFGSPTASSSDIGGLSINGGLQVKGLAGGTTAGDCLSVLPDGTLKNTGAACGVSAASISLSAAPGSLVYADGASSLHGTTTINVSTISATSTAGTNFLMGNTGIGTNTPNAVLAVNAPAGTHSFLVGSSTATNFLVDLYGRTAIGSSTNLGANLQVSSASSSLANLLYLMNGTNATSSAGRLSFLQYDMTGAATTTGAITSTLNANYSRAGILMGSSTLAFSNLQNGALTDALTINGFGNVAITSGSSTSFSVGDRLWVAGAGTSTISGGLTVAGLDSSRGLRVSTGDTILAGGLNVTGSSILPIASTTSFSVADSMIVGGIIRTSNGAGQKVAYGFVGDEKTGMYNNGSANLTFGVSGNTAIQCSGSCSSFFRFIASSNGTAAAPALSVGAASQGGFWAPETSGIGFATNLLDRGRIGADGTWSIASTTGGYGMLNIGGLTVTNTLLATSTTGFSGIATSTQQTNNLFGFGVGTTTLFGLGGATSTNIGNELIYGRLQVKGLAGGTSAGDCLSILPDGTVKNVGSACGTGTSNVTMSSAPGSLIYADGANSLHGTTTINVSNISATSTTGSNFFLAPLFGIGTNTPGTLLSIQNGAICCPATSTFYGLQTSFISSTSTLWNLTTGSSNDASNLNGAFIVGTTTSISGLGQRPEIYAISTSTTGSRFNDLEYDNPIRVAIGTTTQGAELGLRDQFYVAGRINSSWRMFDCNGSMTAINNITSQTTGLNCGDFTLQGRTSFDILNGTSTPGYLYLEGARTKAAATGGGLVAGLGADQNAGGAGNEVGMMQASSTPVYEIWLRNISPGTNGNRISLGFYQCAFPQSTFNLACDQLDPTDGALFTTQDGLNWEAVSWNRGQVTRMQTGVAPCWSTGGVDCTKPAKTLNSFQRLRIEMSSSTVRYFINDKQVAMISSTTPGAATFPGVYVGIKSGAAGTLSPGVVNIARIRVWWNSP